MKSCVMGDCSQWGSWGLGKEREQERVHCWGGAWEGLPKLGRPSGSLGRIDKCGKRDGQWNVISEEAPEFKL